MTTYKIIDGLKKLLKNSFFEQFNKTLIEYAIIRLDELYKERMAAMNNIDKEFLRAEKLQEEIDNIKNNNGLPCKIGDKVYVLRNYNGKHIIKNGVVSEMFYDTDMNLIIVAKNTGRGRWGSKIFGTYESANRKILELGR